MWLGRCNDGKALKHYPVIEKSNELIGVLNAEEQDTEKA